MKLKDFITLGVILFCIGCSVPGSKRSEVHGSDLRGEPYPIPNPDEPEPYPIPNPDEPEPYPIPEVPDDETGEQVDMPGNFVCQTWTFKLIPHGDGRVTVRASSRIRGDFTHRGKLVSRSLVRFSNNQYLKWRQDERGSFTLTYKVNILGNNSNGHGGNTLTGCDVLQIVPGAIISN